MAHFWVKTRASREKMKDRIKTLMESRHMTQQVFASFLNVAPATISGIFNGRTNPTLTIVEAIKKKIPDISTDWLMFGKGPMYETEQTAPSTSSPSPATPEGSTQEPMLDFGAPQSAPSTSAPAASADQPRTSQRALTQTVVKYIDKPQRQITEIRIFYDDQTWETFVPKR